MANTMEKMINDKIRNYRELNKVALKHQIVLAGSSLMDYFPVNELLMDMGITTPVYNRGIASFTVSQYDEVFDVVLDLEPSKLFINIGTNDLNRAGDTIGNLMRKYRALLEKTRAALPQCQITCLAYYPCLEPVEPETREGRIARTNENVCKANEEVKKMCEEMGFGFLDLNGPLKDENGHLKKELALDQLHFSAAGYVEVLKQLKEYL